MVTKEERSAYYKQWYQDNKEKMRKHNLEYRKRNRKKYQDYDSLGRGRDKPLATIEHTKNRRKAYILKKKYGLSLEEFNQMYVNQDGKCAICEDNMIVGTKSCNVDHNHETGKVRALLCGNCNAGIGLLKDSIEVTKKATKYLEKYKPN